MQSAMQLRDTCLSESSLLNDIHTVLHIFMDNISMRKYLGIYIVYTTLLATNIPVLTTTVVYSQLSEIGTILNYLV